MLFCFSDLCNYILYSVHSPLDCFLIVFRLDNTTSNVYVHLHTSIKTHNQSGQYLNELCISEWYKSNIFNDTHKNVQGGTVIVSVTKTI